MKIAVTGATGFLGHYIVRRMLQHGNSCSCWFRTPESQYQIAAADQTNHPSASNGLNAAAQNADIEWVHGELGDQAACKRLLQGCDAVVHSGLYRQGRSFRGTEGEVVEFVQKNIVGTLQLIEAARASGVGRFIFVSTCAVHEKILSDRPLDETHPTWMTTHYGAYKAAVEQFVHSYGFGMGYHIAAVRPSGIYGLHHRPTESKWYELVRNVAAGRTVECIGGGKEVHANDVANAVDLLLYADNIAGEVFSCCDRYVSELEVANLAKQLTGSAASIYGSPKSPKHTIVCDKIQSLGLQFGGEKLLQRTIQQMIDAGAS